VRLHPVSFFLHAAKIIIERQPRKKNFLIIYKI